jgi:hypothetical protein
MENKEMILDQAYLLVLNAKQNLSNSIDVINSIGSIVLSNEFTQVYIDYVRLLDYIFLIRSNKSIDPVDIKDLR